MVPLSLLQTTLGLQVCLWPCLAFYTGVEIRSQVLMPVQEAFLPTRRLSSPDTTKLWLVHSEIETVIRSESFRVVAFWKLHFKFEKRSYFPNQG